MTGRPNTRLADMFRLAGWSKGELARLVNRQAAALGHSQLATDTSRVRRWIDVGETPRDPVPAVLASLFTERLGRVVTTEDLGLRRSGDAGNRKPADGLPWAPHRTAAILTEFTGMDLMLNRRGMVGAGAALLAGSALSDAMHDWLRTTPAPDAATPPHHPPHADAAEAEAAAGLDRYEAAPIGTQEIEALERSVEIFRAWDATRGGGLQRKAVVGQLNEVGGMLAYRHAAAVQQRLWGVAANLAALAGWMSHDVGMESTAQQYFVIASHAAREGGDGPRAGEAMSRAARQMVHLGRPGEALDLMRVAHAGAHEALPHTRAMLFTIEAWAYAAMGRGQATRRALGRAEEMFVADRNDEPPPCWMQMFDEADLHGMEALAYRTLAEHEPGVARLAETHARQALELRCQGRDRSQIFDHITAASACLLADDPDQADSHARRALGSIGSNSSHRTWDRLRAMYGLTGRYADSPAIGALRAEIQEVLPGAPGGAGARAARLA